MLRDLIDTSDVSGPSAELEHKRHELARRDAEPYRHQPVEPYVEPELTDHERAEIDRELAEERSEFFEGEDEP